MLRAALASRSWTTPQAWQAQARMPSGWGAVPVPAGRAELRGRLPATDLDDPAPVLGGLVLQQPDQGRPSGVVDALGQPGTSKSGHAQLLDGNHLVLADQPKGELVVVIGPPVANLAVGDRDPHPGLGAVGGSFLLPGQAALGAG